VILFLFEYYLTVCVPFVTVRCSHACVVIHYIPTHSWFISLSCTHSFWTFWNSAVVLRIYLIPLRFRSACFYTLPRFRLGVTPAFPPPARYVCYAYRLIFTTTVVTLYVCRFCSVLFAIFQHHTFANMITTLTLLHLPIPVSITFYTRFVYINTTVPVRYLLLRFCPFPCTIDVMVIRFYNQLPLIPSTTISLYLIFVLPIHLTVHYSWWSRYLVVPDVPFYRYGTFYLLLQITGLEQYHYVCYHSLGTCTHRSCCHSPVGDFHLLRSTFILFLVLCRFTLRFYHHSLVVLHFSTRCDSVIYLPIFPDSRYHVLFFFGHFRLFVTLCSFLLYHSTLLRSPPPRLLSTFHLRFQILFVAFPIGWSTFGPLPLFGYFTVTLFTGYFLLSLHYRTFVLFCDTYISRYFWAG